MEPRTPCSTEVAHHAIEHHGDECPDWTGEYMAHVCPCGRCLVLVCPACLTIVIATGTDRDVPQCPHFRELAETPDDDEYSLLDWPVLTPAEVEERFSE